MSFDSGDDQEVKPGDDPTQQKQSRSTRKSFRVSNSRQTSPQTEEAASATSSNKKAVFISAVPSNEAAPLNDNLAEITPQEEAKSNPSLNFNQTQATLEEQIKNGLSVKDNAGNEWQESSFKGRRPGDRYIRLSRASSALEADASFNRDRLLFSNTMPAEPRTPLGRVWLRLKRVLIGIPLANSEAIHQRLSKVQALAVLSSDALSSIAYATEQILLVLAATQGQHRDMVIPISLAIAFLLIIVSLSYRQTIHAYPLGGGSYIVAKDNLGVNAGLIAAASLMIDYVLTVAVSITAGIGQIISAFPSLSDWKVELCLLAIAFISIANLRGVKESGAIFTAPTYIFIVSIIIMLLFGFLDWVGVSVFQSNLRPVDPISQADQFSLFIVLRAFASGCTALTGVEAISDGVPAFRKPESKNAAATLTWMATILVTLFMGISVLAWHFDIHPWEETNPNYDSVTSQIARQAVGDTPLYYIIQAATAMILVLAANTAFSDFPRLSWFLARDKFLPHLFNHKGDRLAFTTGIVVLAALAASLVIIFGGKTDALIPLYAVGVFLSFTLSQAGMVRRWWRLRTPGWQRSMMLNGLGALLTFMVLIVIAATKFLAGAWLVVMLIPCIFLMFRQIHWHYDKFQNQLSVGNMFDQPFNMANHTVLVPINDVNPITRRTLSYARSLSDSVIAIHVNDDPEKIALLRQKWDDAGLEIPLVVVETPFRAIIGPLLAYIDTIHKREPDETITVVIPEFMTAQWWQQLLHNQTAFRLRTALMLRPGIVITSVPYHLRH